MKFKIRASYAQILSDNSFSAQSVQVWFILLAIALILLLNVEFLNKKIRRELRTYFSLFVAVQLLSTFTVYLVGVYFILSEKLEIDKCAYIFSFIQLNRDIVLLEKHPLQHHSTIDKHSAYMTLKIFEQLATTARNHQINICVLFESFGWDPVRIYKR